MKVKLKLEVVLEDVDRDMSIDDIADKVREASHGDFAKAMWSLGDYVDFHIKEVKCK